MEKLSFTNLVSSAKEVVDCYRLQVDHCYRLQVKIILVILLLPTYHACPSAPCLRHYFLLTLSLPLPYLPCLLRPTGHRILKTFPCADISFHVSVLVQGTIPYLNYRIVSLPTTLGISFSPNPVPSPSR